VSPREVDDVFATLAAAGVLVLAADTGDGAAGQGYVPACSPEQITVVDVLHALRGSGPAEEAPERPALDRMAARALARLDHEVRTSVHNRNLRDLVEEARRSAEAAGAPAVPKPAHST